MNTSQNFKRFLLPIYVDKDNNPKYVEGIKFSSGKCIVATSEYRPEYYDNIESLLRAFPIAFNLNIEWLD